MLAGSEGVRTAIERDRVLGLSTAALPANQPLPPAADLAPLAFPQEPPGPDGKPAQEPKIEPIARHVPAEFFYIRFGSFDNFLWFQDRLDTWGGDLQNPSPCVAELPEEPANPGSTRAGADAAFADVRRHGDFRRGDGGHRSVDAGRRGDRIYLRGPQRHHAGLQPLGAASRPHQGRERPRRKRSRSRDRTSPTFTRPTARSVPSTGSAAITTS